MTRLYARASDAKGAALYGIPGGRIAIPRVPFGRLLFVAGDPVWHEKNWFFPVQVDVRTDKGVETSILWASEQGFSIVKGAS